jgi:hypothetical protein
LTPGNNTDTPRIGGYMGPTADLDILLMARRSRRRKEEKSSSSRTFSRQHYLVWINSFIFKKFI